MIASKLKTVMIFSNGGIAAFDEQGKQMPELQKGWINYESIKALAEVVVRDNPTIEGKFPLNGYDPLDDYVKTFEARFNKGRVNDRT